MPAMEKDNEIIYIANAASLQKFAASLQSKKSIAFDTEFDRFYREYGFKLSLLQIYDGKICYIIDPIKITDLSALWPVFENEEIMKVAYSCSEDVQILKLHGCNPRNIYDLQIAAKLANSTALSYADLLLQEMNIELDKSLQRSDWRRRPLSKRQLQYASQDVVPLLQVQEVLQSRVEANDTVEFLSQDNKECEEIEVSEYTVKLSAKQKKQFDTGTQKFLYALMLQRDEIAQQYNMPPANVCGDRILEEFIENKNEGFPQKGISGRLREDEHALNKLEAVLEQEVKSLPSLPAEERNQNGYGNRYNNAIPLTDKEMSDIKDEVTRQYGQIAADHILRGFKKYLSSSAGLQPLRPYQQEVIKEAAAKFGIVVK